MDFAALAADSRVPLGRSEVLKRNLVPELLPRLQACINQDDVQQVQECLPLLRLLRNLCSDEGFQVEFCEGGGLELVAALISKLLRLWPGADEDSCCFKLVQVLVQIVANVSRQPAARELIWSIFFPDMLMKLASLSLKEVPPYDEPMPMLLHEPICLILDCCSRPEHLAELAGAAGARIIAMLLRGSKCPTGNVWLNSVLETLCLKEEYFQSLFTNLGSLGGEQVFSSDQVLLLENLSYPIEDDPWCRQMQPASVAFLVNIIELAATDSASAPEGATFLTGTPAVDVLGLSLVLLKNLCSHEDKENDQGEEPGSRVRGVLASSKLVEYCLDMLRALGPPEMIKKANAKQQQQKQKQLRKINEEEQGTTSTSEADDKPVDEQVASAAFPRENLYPGYRRDIVAVITNLACDNVPAQERVRQCGGLLLILQQCVVDDQNPYLREWGFLAIRNLTHGNAENARELASLEMQKPVETQEVVDAGFRIEMDPCTLRPKLVNR